MLNIHHQAVECNVIPTATTKDNTASTKSAFEQSVPGGSGSKQQATTQSSGRGESAKRVLEHLQDPAECVLRYFAFQVACDLSDLAAVMLYDIHHRTADRKGPLKRDGYSWTYDTLKVFASNHPYASVSGIRKALLALEEGGFIRIEKTGKYNKKRYDEKWWYALTDKGKARVAKWRMRFHPDTAACLDATKKDRVLGIPKAVILQNFCHQFHKGGDEYVRLEPAELKIPYSTKTIERHLNGIVANNILERHPDDKHCYRMVDRWRENEEPLTVPCSKLLPSLEHGELGLITAPSAGGKTSYGTFCAVQHALAGWKVVHVTLEEPLSSVVQRIYAQEHGLSYTDLHRRSSDVMNVLRAKQQTNTERMKTLASNLKLVDLHGQCPTPDSILEAIAGLAAQGFHPDMVFIDQLEFSSSGEEEEPDEPSSDLEDEESDDEPVARAVPLALALSDAFRGQPFCTWVLHQVDGSPRPEFGLKDVAGRAAVTDCFDVVLGLGRTDHDKERCRVDLRVFSLRSATEFATIFAADFAHMRFKPKR